jgi:hypothetical protein
MGPASQALRPDADVVGMTCEAEKMRQGRGQRVAGETGEMRARTLYHNGVQEKLMPNPGDTGNLV